MDVKTKIAMLPGIGGKPKLMNDVLNDLADHESQVYERQEIDQAITAALNPDTAVTSGSDDLVTSGAVYTHVGDRIIDNLTSTDTDNALSANQGNILNLRLNNLEAIGRFLSLWDCTIGLPTTEPPSLPYEYKTGDYFIISNVGTTNYKPTGTSYTGTASTTIVDEAIKVNDFFVFDGTTWKVLKNSKNDEVVLTLNEFNALTTVDPNTHYIITENFSIIKALQFTANGASTLGITNNGGNAPILEKSTDGKNWTSWDYSTINIADGETVCIRGNNPNGFSETTDKYSTFTMSGSIACSGNIMHLLDYSQDLNTIPNPCCFYRLFENCTNLTIAPELPATTLANACYQSMFQGCTNLTQASILPATTLYANCYTGMFKACTSLTTAPELLAPSSVNGCYQNMFQNCTKLSNIKCLLSTITTSLSQRDLRNWVSGVASSGTFTKRNGVEWKSGANGIPSGWTVVEVN